MARKSAQSEPEWTTVRRAEAFCAVAELRNWKHASVRIGRGSSSRAAWRLVNELAKDLGAGNTPLLFEPVPVADRTNPDHSLRLTAEGAHVLPLARQLVSAAVSLKSALDPRSGDLRLACYPAHLRMIVAPLHAGGEVSLDVVAADDALRERHGEALFDRLFDHRTDVVIAPERKVPGIDALRLYQWHLVAAIPRRHRLAGLNGAVEPGELIGERLLLSPPNHTSREIVDQAIPGEVEPYYENSSTESLLAYVEAGLGIALLPNDALWPSPEHRVIRPFLPGRFHWHALHWRAGEEATDGRLAELISALSDERRRN